MGSRSDRDEVTRRVGNNHHHFAMACIKNGNYSCGFDSYDDFWRALTESQGLAGADLSRLLQAHHAVLRDRLRKNLLRSRPNGPFTLTAKSRAFRSVVALIGTLKKEEDASR